ncbi:hypothetical protein ACFWNG_08280 [Streptomyces sp. NPDC058391]|uniref:hypothetical protein n=1 Tax=Streptomyces sp. NPDC058391 TaxID=3346476 RepID=UPI003653E243
MSADDSAEPLAHRWSAVMMDTYGTPPLALVRGAVSTVWDKSGRAYTDFTGGIAVNTAGTSTVRLAPPLTVTEEEIAALVKDLPGILGT